MNRTVDMIRQISEILNHPVYLLDESYNVILGIDQEQLLLSKKNMNSKNLIPLRDKRGKTYYLYIKKELSNEVYQLAKLLLENCIRQLTLGDREEILKDILKEREDVDLLYRLYGATFLKAEAYSILFIRGIQEGEFNLYQIIQSLFRDCSYCTSVLLEEGIVLLIDRKLSKKQLDEVAKSIRDTVNAELYVDVMIGISEEGRGILQLRKSFMEAKESIAIGERFFMGKHIYFYEDLQLERMVLGIPIEERKKNIY